MLLEQERWITQGNCVGVDPESFFYTDERPSVHKTAYEERAKQVCNGCPVSGQCLERALNEHHLGVWGGTTYEERRKIKRGGDRKSCMRCQARDVVTRADGQICLFCGLSWLT